MKIHTLTNLRLFGNAAFRRKSTFSAGVRAVSTEQTWYRTEVHTVTEFIQEKKQVAKNSLLIAFILVTLSLFLGELQVALGLSSGLAIIFLNYFVMAAIIDCTVRDKATRVNPLFSLMAYLVRFWVLVVFLHIVFTTWGAKFGLSIVIGMSIIKLAAFFEVLQSSLTDNIYPPNVLTKKIK